VLASVCSLSLAGCSSSAPAIEPTGSAPSPARTLAVQATPVADSGAATAAAAATPTPSATPAPIAYVALGDSYTIGTSVKPRERWPNQLARTLGPATGLTLEENLAVDGDSTKEVIANQLSELPRLDPGFVSLLVGVNDVVRNVDIDTYRTNLRTIFNALLEVVPANRILLVTTPDYTLTPHGSDYGDQARQSARIHTFNAVLAKEAAQLQLLVVDISGVANRVPEDASLVAADGLHPSAKQYAAWVDQMAPSVRMLLSGGSTP